MKPTEHVQQLPFGSRGASPNRSISLSCVKPRRIPGLSLWITESFPRFPDFPLDRWGASRNRSVSPRGEFVGSWIGGSDVERLAQGIPQWMALHARARWYMRWGRCVCTAGAAGTGQADSRARNALDCIVGTQVKSDARKRLRD